MNYRFRLLTALPSFRAYCRTGIGLVFFVMVMASSPHGALTAQQLSDLPQTPWTSWLQQSQSRSSENQSAVIPRCLTTHISEQIRSQSMADPDFESLFFFPDSFEADNSFQSPDGGYIIWYDLSGEHAVPAQDTSGSGIPDWIEMVANAADSSRAFYRDSLGFKDPVDGFTPYNIYIRNLGIYGFTGLQNGIPYSVIDSRFDWIPGNDAEDEAVGAAQATIAHEIYHSVQYGYNQWQGPTGDTAWLEMDALMAENQVFPEVNEYLNFIGDGSIFRIPARSTPVAYDHATWLMYFTESVSPEFMRTIWERVEISPQAPMETLIAEELDQRGLSFKDEIIKLHLWHLASGSWSRPGFGFADAERYPTSFKRSQRITLPDVPYPMASTAANAAGYYAIVPQTDFSGNTLAAFFSNSPQTGWGLLAYYTDGSVEMILPDENFGLQPVLFASEWAWDEIEQLGIVVVNTDRQVSNIHQLLLGNQDTIEQIRYGDVLADGEVDETDAATILEQVASQFASPLSFAGAYAADVTGNGVLSAFDAGLIYRKASGFSGIFPADLNETGFGPDLPRFFPEEARAPHANALLSNVPITVELQADQLYRGDEAMVDMYVAGLPSNALSVELKIYFPPALIEFQDVLSSFSNFDEIIRSEHSDEAGVVRLAWASNQYAGEGILGTLVFQITGEGTAEVIPEFARINEFESDYELISVAFETEPQDPVSLEPGPPQDDDNDNTELPGKTELLPAYPNPFNPVTVIPIQLSEPSEVNLRVYDTAGRLVATLSDGNQLSGGQHVFRWDAAGFASGVYFVLLEATGRGETGAVVRTSRSITLLR